ncbi:MAG TPA: hypothetical protein VKR22_13235 [Acidimicrobiales bacterium]|nr:hypothetical protein [Acidimicrobiales bacterium]
MGTSRRTTGGRLLLGALAMAATTVGFGSLASSAGASGNATHGLKQRSHDSSFHHGPRPSNLVDHGGAVLPSPDVYVVWWGSSSAWASDVQTGMASFFAGLNGSSYVNTAKQYERGASVTVTVKGTASDSSTPPSNASPAQLAAEAQKEFPTADPNGMYVVFTSNFPSGGNFCAWHSYGTVNGQTDSVAYMPNTTNVAGCDPGNLYGTSGSEGLRSLANVTAHEFMESVTDPLVSAWYDSSGSEIGDKCAWQFASKVTLHNGTAWQLQEEWSNAVTGCVETS